MIRAIDKRRVLGTLFVALALAVIVGAQPAFAYVDQGVSFNFTIRGYCLNGRESDARHRDTLMVDNQWKVKMTWSDEKPEASDTITKFWLESNTGANVSPSVLKQEGDGYTYKSAYLDACNAWVWLTGENNNFNSDVYEVIGYWDEETGVAP